VITPKIGTTLEMASDTLLNATTQPAMAIVVTQIKNMAAFTTSKKKTLFCSNTAQKRVLLTFSPCPAWQRG
jgi:hypothetical protein